MPDKPISKNQVRRPAGKPAREGWQLKPRLPKILRALGVLLLPSVLAGCGVVVLDPSGYIAVLQRNLILASTVLMLLIIVPVIVLTLLFARRYWEGNPDGVYDPEFHHSTQLEVVIWSAPLAIIICLGAMTWLSTHTLDPFRTLDRISGSQSVAPNTKPLNVDVVSLDWKWLFIYPDLGIASLNELAAPVNVPIAFKITSASVMNTFFIPALAGQIYSMAGMQTQLHAVINEVGDYDGFSGNYSGSGFSHMNFTFHGMSPQGFDQWVAKVKNSGSGLTRADYMKLEQPSEAVPVQYFSTVENGLFDAIVNLCVEPGKMCKYEMNRIDAAGGGGKDSRENYERLRYINIREGREAPAATFPAQGRRPRTDVRPEGTHPGPAEHPEPAKPGAGTPAPGQLNQKTDGEQPK
ncbi:MAG: ubiquinol oxidase subunit II [Acetobacteraceae bacterium]|nr:ubiquinol oxidase subunit II [Acetobacteraceae bacterium]MBV8524398.1 ubiquinol oxidase subunit II [Acetobacteraceae bacterium]